MLDTTESLLPKPPVGRKLKVLVASAATGEMGEESINEMQRLLTTLGVETAVKLQLGVRKIHPGTYVGQGKLEEIKAQAEAQEADAVILDVELSPSQLKNIEKFVGRHILDRPGVIIEIFSRHARTNEAKTQVELAKLQYLLPRLAHFWTHFERQRGGIGLKGMGEKQIEVDRRLVKKRMSTLRERLAGIDRDRELHRVGRKDIFKVALVGYTNAGKSTLLNALTRSDVLAEDKLFATLDANVRSLDPDSRPPIVMIDTVGFISQLPHALVASFRSTLRELHEADLLLHVVDASAAHAREQIQVTLDVLKELGLEEKPRLVVLNKIDVAEKKLSTRNAARLVAPGAIAVSALRPDDVKKLRTRIQEHFRGGMDVWEVLIPYSESKMDAEVHAHGVVEKTKHHEKGTFYRLRMAESWAKKLRLDRYKLGWAGVALLLGAMLNPWRALSPLAAHAGASPAKPKYAYRYDFRHVEGPLTTAEARRFEPKLVNPHQARWSLEHTVLLAAIETFKLSSGKIGVRRLELDAPTRLHLRAPDGPWYVDEERFPCTKERQPVFATWAGSRHAGELGATEWEKILSSGVSELETRMKKIAEPSTERARLRVQREYLDWLDDLEEKWAKIRATQLATAEWKFYLDAARKAGRCANRSEIPNLPFWEEVMEPLVPPSPGPGAPRPLTRAPAKRWDGAFSVRLAIQVLGRKLNGQFLVDPRSEVSVAAPSWLSGQGVDPKLLRGKYAPIEKVELTGMRPALAPMVRFDRVQLGGLDMPFLEFALFETDLYDPPDSFGSCCDGVIGRDLIRRYALEFSPGPPNELKLWDPANFLPAGYDWFEVSETPSGTLESHCMIALEGRKTKERSRVRWNFALDSGLSIDPTATAGSRADSAGLRCGGIWVVRDAEFEGANPDRADTYPSRGALAGVDILLRGLPTILDAPNGRLWIRSNLEDKPVIENTTGLEVEYSFHEMERVLRVTDIEKGSRAWALTKQPGGLTIGTFITQVDGDPIENMDAWLVEQHLAHAFGPRVTIQWRTPKGELKLAPLD